MKKATAGQAIVISVLAMNLFLSLPRAQDAVLEEGPRLHTRSIVACDPIKRECGVAVVSFPTGVPSIVPVGEPGIIVANQSVPNLANARRIIAAVLGGTDPATAIADAMAVDPNRDLRQIGVAALSPASSSGVVVSSFSGGKLIPKICNVTGLDYAVQANRQTSETVCQAMAQAFEASQGSLSRRLLTALKEGGAAGSDALGDFSASVRVYQNSSILGQFGWTVTGPDASVDRARDWASDLEFSLNAYIAIVHEGYAADLVPLTDTVIRQILRVLIDLGYYVGKPDGWGGKAEQALAGFMTANSFFPRGTVVQGDQRFIDAAVAGYIVQGMPRNVLIPKK